MGIPHIHRHILSLKPSALLVTSLLLVSTIFLLASVRATDCSTTLVFRPTDDATVRADQPDTNFGTSTTLVADASPLRNFLLKFSISGVGSCQVTSAKLRLFQVDSSDRGGGFHITTGAWSDSTVKWNYNFHTLRTVVASLGRVCSRHWYGHCL